MTLDWFANFEFLFRWLHVMAGLMWIGHLYFFNFTNGHTQAKFDGPTKKVVNPQLMPRALYWFRWGAMVTFIMGLILFTMLYMYTPGVGFGPSGNFKNAEGMTPRAAWILLGMLCGTIMWFNVWFVITPRQAVIQASIRDGKPPPADMVKTATNASKMNTYLSGPMLFGMLGANHFGAPMKVTLAIAGVCIVLALAAIYHVYKVAPKVEAGFATAGGGGDKPPEKKEEKKEEKPAEKPPEKKEEKKDEKKEEKKA